MRLVKLSLFIFYLSLNQYSNAQTHELEHQEMKIVIGKSCPDYIFQNIINYKSNKASLSDFKGKFLILDFWTTWCIPCIAIIPKMEDLQKKFDTKLQILMVCVENQSKALNFLKRRKEENKPILLPCAIDTILSSLIHIQSVPHEIWIDENGIVRAITDHRSVTEANVQKFLYGDSLNLPFKAENQRIAFDLKKPFLVDGNGGNGDNIVFRSILTQYIEGIDAMYSYPKSGKGTRISGWNQMISSLYMQAYGDSTGRYPYNRTRLEMSNSGKYKYNGVESFEDWKHKNMYCYELNVPEEKSNNILKIMQQDLNRYFGLNVKREKRKQKCLILMEKQKGKLFSNGGKPEQKWDVTGITLKNMPISSFFDMLEGYQQDKIIINETNFKGNVDIELDCNMLELNELKKSLSKYGLDLIETEREIEMLILSDPKPEYND